MYRYFSGRMLATYERAGLESRRALHYASYHALLFEAMEPDLLIYFIAVYVILGVGKLDHFSISGSLAARWQTGLDPGCPATLLPLS